MDFESVLSPNTTLKLTFGIGETNQIGILLETDIEFELFDERRMCEDEEHLREEKQGTLHTDLRGVHLQVR